MKFRVSKKLRKILFVIVSSILLIPVLLFALLYFIFLTPSKLTPMVKDIISENINGRFNCESVDLTLSTYPNIGIKISNAQFILDDRTFVNDTLLTFSEALISIQPFSLIFDNKLVSRHSTIHNPSVFIAVNRRNKINWEVLLDVDTESDLEDMDFPKLVVKNGEIKYHNDVDRSSGSINGLTLEANGFYSLTEQRLDYKFRWDGCQYKSSSYKLPLSFAAESNAKLVLMNKLKNIEIKSFETKFNTLYFNADGIINRTDDKSLNIDLMYDLKISNIRELIAFFGDNRITEKESEVTAIEINNRGHLEGRLSDTSFPVFKGDIFFKIGGKDSPLRPELIGSTISIDKNNISLTNSTLQIGDSKLLFTGKIQDYKYLLDNVKGSKISVIAQSDYIDGDQLAESIEKGLRLNDIKSGNLPVEESDNLKSAIKGQSLLVVPEYLDMEFNAKIDKIEYKDLTANNITGLLKIKNGVVQLQNLNSVSNIGNANFSMFYKAETRTKGRFGMDMNTKGIKIDKLIELMPSVDTVMPMLKSLEGTVDVSITSIGNLNAHADIMSPSLEATASIKGSDVVLLGGETFSNIAKKLKFKDKKRNKIDSIAVEVILQNSKLELFPFLLEVDRYRVAVGGVHNLDADYDYHVSVLKSPLPFKIGVNIKGNASDNKIRLGKAKYNDTRKESKAGTIDPERVKQKNSLHDKLLEEFSFIMGIAKDKMPSYRFENIRLDAVQTQAFTNVEDEEEYDIDGDKIVVVKNK